MKFLRRAEVKQIITLENPRCWPDGTGKSKTEKQRGPLFERPVNYWEFVMEQNLKFISNLIFNLRIQIANRNKSRFNWKNVIRTNKIHNQ